MVFWNWRDRHGECRLRIHGSTVCLAVSGRWSLSHGMFTVKVERRGFKVLRDKEGFGKSKYGEFVHRASKRVLREAAIWKLEKLQEIHLIPKNEINSFDNNPPRKLEQISSHPEKA